MMPPMKYPGHLCGWGKTFLYHQTRGIHLRIKEDEEETKIERAIKDLNSNLIPGESPQVSFAATIPILISGIVAENFVRSISSFATSFT